MSAPGSETVKLYVWLVPSLAVASPVRVTVGATLAMATVIESSDGAPGSSSLAVTETIELAGPSGKVQSKLLGAGCR